jgi:hypothetical protein
MVVPPGYKLCYYGSYGTLAPAHNKGALWQTLHQTGTLLQRTQINCSDVYTNRTKSGPSAVVSQHTEVRQKHDDPSLHPGEAPTLSPPAATAFGAPSYIHPQIYLYSKPSIIRGPSRIP